MRFMSRKIGFLLLVLLLYFEFGYTASEIELSSIITSNTDPATQEDAARGVLKRLLPKHESSFQLQIISKEPCGGKACFHIENHPLKSIAGGPEIRISGTSGVELCAGLYWYLKRRCGAHISWDKTGGKQLSTVPEPGSLPPLETGGVKVVRPVPWSYYQNVVTSSYSFVWWNWERWEQEIDWMALQGINLPLASTGQETIWQKVFQSKRFNLSKADLDEYFSGPAFLAWARMGNLHGDTFNENLPPTDDPTYISTLGASVYKAMSAGDSQAVWLMQALLHSVPVGKMLVLDLFADVKPVWKRSDQFYGVPYIWCMLHNFGGNIEMYGRVDTVGSGPIEALSSLNSTMVGVGMCMEGIEHNPVVYELMGEMAFRNETVYLEDWILDYSIRRYGKASGGAQEAWKILHQTIYNCQDGIADHNGDVIVEFPDKNPDLALVKQDDNYLRLEGSTTGATDGALRGGSLLGHIPHIWYSQADAVRALGFLLSSSDELGDGLPYRYDLVDLTRQVLSKRANELYTEIIRAYGRKDLEDLQRLGDSFLELFSDMERLLASCEGFLLGPWLESAKSLSTNLEEKKLYEWNARTQLTMWFDNTEDKPSPLHDYGK
ncbi:hypothetical protein R1sor_024167 [Riccia sorocarpa]|uniref:Alpha-N-acetylglucosaminidase n=1 Tax=Riccia sorocarpa TaxID=122646 RepID=A0ABD3GRK0_9MARC